jgi:hypothetical protein
MLPWSWSSAHKYKKASIGATGGREMEVDKCHRGEVTCWCVLDLAISLSTTLHQQNFKHMLKIFTLPSGIFLLFMSTFLVS